MEPEQPHRRFGAVERRTAGIAQSCIVEVEPSVDACVREADLPFRGEATSQVHPRDRQAVEPEDRRIGVGQLRTHKAEKPTDACTKHADLTDHDYLAEERASAHAEAIFS